MILRIAVFAFIAAPAVAEVSFVNDSAGLGVEQVYSGGWNHFVGGGVAVFDCNGDARPEIYAAGGEGPSRLFLNTSETAGPLTFSDAGIMPISDVTGAYPVDVDRDGHDDLVVLRNGPNMLLQGQGDCRFAPAPADWHFDGGNEWTTAFSATWEAGQSWPTLAFGNYVDHTNPDGPFEACDTNYLVRPDGNRFGARVPLQGFCTLSMLFSDWTRTGTPELRVSNDRQYYVRDGREQMWRMDTLAERTEADGWPTLKIWGMGIASRDITGDGLPEVVLTSMGDQQIQINQGGGVMKAAPYGIGTYATVPYMGDDGRASTGWHAEFGDLDNDGLDDLFIAKGNVDQMPSNAIHDPNNLLMQQPDGTFVEMGGVTGVGTGDRSRGAALADMNRDGRLDIVVVNRRSPVELWRNTTPDAGRYVKVTAMPVGSIIDLRLPDGRILTREVTVGGGHVSGQSGPLHFGVGNATEVDLRATPNMGGAEWVTVQTVATDSPYLTDAIGTAVPYQPLLTHADHDIPDDMASTKLTDADFPAFSEAEVELGRLLFWDPILSGNKNIACATCHHPKFGTSDGLSLGMGEGGMGLGLDRVVDPNDVPEQRIPRNSPALWNVGSYGYTAMFADGRIEIDPSRESGFRTPLEDEMVTGFASLLSAQTMFPVLSNDEMAGHYEESDVSQLIRQGRITGDDGAWATIAARVSAIPDYEAQFKAVYPEIAAGRPIHFTDISNAIAAFVTVGFKSTGAQFNDVNFAPTPEAEAGMTLFFGKAGCASCHSGPLLSDMAFHAMGEPQIGPGKAERFERHQRDTGRMRVTNDPADAYAFRTPSLWNVTLTAPYGHAGAYPDLEAFLGSHLSGGADLASYDPSKAILPDMTVAKPDMNPAAEGGANYDAIAASARPAGYALTAAEIDQLIAFLQTLEDPTAKAGGHFPIPDSVPSGLPVDR